MMNRKAAIFKFIDDATGSTPVSIMLKDHLIGIGIPFFALGAGTALAADAVARIDQNIKDKKLRETLNRSSRHTMEVVLPENRLGVSSEDGNKLKKAEYPAYQVASDLLEDGSCKIAGGDRPTSVIWSAPLLLGTTILPMYYGYKVTDYLLRRNEKKSLQDSMNRIKDNYSKVLLADVIKNPEGEEYLNKNASTNASNDCLSELAKISVNSLNEFDPIPSSKKAIWPFPHKTEDFFRGIASIPFGIAGVTGYLAYRYSLNRERELDKYYNSNATIPETGVPQQIKFVPASKTEIENSGFDPAHPGSDLFPEDVVSSTKDVSQKLLGTAKDVGQKVIGKTKEISGQIAKKVPKKRNKKAELVRHLSGTTQDGLNDINRLVEERHREVALQKQKSAHLNGLFGLRDEILKNFK